MFMDLCSLSNVSVMILVEDQYGYYIHGESVHSHADCNMKEFNMNLEREKENIVVSRGLIVGNTGGRTIPCQSFQMYLTSQFREELKQRYLLPSLIKSQKESQNKPEGIIDGQQTVNQNATTAETAKKSNNPKVTEEPSKQYPRFYDLINGRLPFLMRFDVPTDTMVQTYTAVNSYLKQFITAVLFLCIIFSFFLIVFL